MLSETKEQANFCMAQIKDIVRTISAQVTTVCLPMKQLGLVCQVRAKRKYNSYKGEVGKVAPNLLERHFKANQPNRKWVTDVTEFKVNDQKLYLSPILDLFNGEVVSYNLSRHPNFKQITDMLEGAFQKLAG